MATSDIEEGESVTGVYMDDDSTVEVVSKGDIPLGHKIAVEESNSGGAVIEYGGSDRGGEERSDGRRLRPHTQSQEREVVDMELYGYRRENGRVGVRNHVVILPVDDISNAACEAVANNIKGTLALPHSYGRLQYGEDLDLHFRTMIGTGANPNVAAVIVIGIEDNWTNRIADGIAETGKPVAAFAIEGYGDLETVRRASWKAREFVQWATELRREPVEPGELTVSIKCGESDTTTGLGSCPTVGVAVDRLLEEGATVFFGETSELTGWGAPDRRTHGDA